MARQRSKGTCSFCNATFTKAGMTKHLKSCTQRNEAAEMVSDKQVSRSWKAKIFPKLKSREKKIFHLLVEGRYIPMYWMHLEVPADVTLEDLDKFLRDTWLECCGHLSAFTIQSERYLSDLFDDDDDLGMEGGLGEVLRPGMKFYHEYDFGTPTELTLKVLSAREGEFRGHTIQVLARNEPPLTRCDSCGKIAKHICTKCLWSGEGGWLCSECAHEHECGEERLLPVANSPRVGICGYTGEVFET